MAKRRRSFSISRVWQYIGLGALAVVVGVMVWTAFQPVEPPATAYESRPVETPTPTPTPEVLQIAATNGRPAPVALLLGDSYSADVGASAPENGYASIVARELGWDMTVLSAPGGGYSLPGVNGQSIVQMYEATDVATLQPDVVIIQSGYNDTSAQDEDVRAAIRQIQSDITATLPDVPVVVVGQFWPGEATPSSSARAATIQSYWSGRSNVLLLDPIAEGWSAFATTDDRHPDDAGHALIAAQIIAAMRADGLIP